MAHHPHAFLPGASKRLEALSDGVFAIACTLLVLEIEIPHFNSGINVAEQWHEFSELMPSLIAFVFSFLNILVFWANHDAINKVIVRYDTKTTYLNIVFLLFISLIPFTTAFIGQNPHSFVAIAAYGLVLMFASATAIWMYSHLAFKSNLLLPEVSERSKKTGLQADRFKPICIYGCYCWRAYHYLSPYCYLYNYAGHFYVHAAT